LVGLVANVRGSKGHAVFLEAAREVLHARPEARFLIVGDGVGFEDVRRRVRELTNGRGADVVIDVSSYAVEPVAGSLDYVAPGGAVVLAGVKGFRPIPDFVSDKLVMKEVRVFGAIGVTSSAYRAAIRLIESGKTPLAQMHTHDFALRDAERAIRTLARQIPGEESIHSCLIPG
ncbi:MAG: zinc-binding dehydrogenase, partial [Myxococcota bacterium]